MQVIYEPACVNQGKYTFTLKHTSDWWYSWRVSVLCSKGEIPGLLLFF